MQLYYQTQYRYSAYAAGVIVGVIVNGRDDQVSQSANAGAFASWVVLMSSLAVVAIVIATGGGDADLEDVMYNGADLGQMLRQKHRKMDGFWFRLQVALQRPLLDLAAASLTWLCVSSRCPRLARVLGAKVWRPLAALSYSIYLLQFIVTKLVGEHLYRLFRLGNITSHVAQILILLVGPLVLVIFTLPFGFILYSLVERPGILLGKRVISAMPVAVKPCDAPAKRTLGSTADDVESQCSTAESQCSTAESLPDEVTGDHFNTASPSETSEH